MESCELTILMPCLNESETLARCIQKAKEFLQMEQVQGEILIADNGSTDGSQEIAKKLGARVISVPIRGYGAALKSGMQMAYGRYIIMGDADDSYDFLNLKPFLNKLREGYDLVMGNRFRGGIEKGAMPFLNRYVGNPILSLIGRIFFNSNIGDFHCGLRGFCCHTVRQLDLHGDGMEFASEMIVKATLKKLNITEVPTALHPDGRSRKPHLRPWRDGWRHLRLLLLLSPRWLFLYPGCFLFAIGVLLMTTLILGPIEIGQVNLDIHTMLFSSLFMIVGLQAICFAFSAKYIADYHMKIEFSNHYFPPILKHIKMEHGLAVGFILLTLGAAGSCYTLMYWIHHAFGPLVPTQMMRVLIPSITCLVLGIQLIFASFFMSVLAMHVGRK
ncbi:MAG: glycosyltransferase family 2 protein [Gammaproteobacteria bacterium]|nr:glycosyltransferase family 2 protein [Gammaproteobacteria bacterium]MCW5582278.1 glycosyltransferase family 2 protein [Gammaproteobacteria bacterium]